MKRLTFFMVAIMALCLTAIAQKQSSKTLVAYFSATGTTEKAAKVVAEVTSGTLYEIQPAKKYTSADLDWHDKSSRSSVEMADAKSRPALSSKAENLADYDTIYIGFPIWWNLAPRIINTFIESGDSVCHVGRKQYLQFRKGIAENLFQFEVAERQTAERCNQRRH